MKNKMFSLIPNPAFSQHFGSLAPDEIPLKVRAIAWCMDITGMEALFTRADMHEMLVRLFSSVPELLPEKHFADFRCLFTFRNEDMPFRIYPEDITACLGLYIWDLPENDFNRGQWLKNLPELRRSAEITAGFFRQTLNPTAVEENRGRISEIIPGEGEIAAAERMVAYVMGGISDEVFSRFEQDCKAALNQIRAKVKRASEPLPISFDWNALPEQTRHTFIRHILEEDSHEGISLEEIRKDWPHIEDLAHLVWASQNGLIRSMDFLIFDPRWDVDIARYDYLGHDLGINFRATWTAYNLDEVADLIPGELPETEQWIWDQLPEPDFVEIPEFTSEERENDGSPVIPEVWSVLDHEHIKKLLGPPSSMRIPVNKEWFHPN
jgi:hypothetical protein